MANFTWIAVGDAKTCEDCAGRSGESMPLADWESLGLPGDGATICGDHCRCVVMADSLIGDIAEREGLTGLSVPEIIDAWGLGVGIRVIPVAAQSTLISVGLPDLADLDYEDARDELLALLRGRRDFDSTYEVMSLSELARIYGG